MKAFTFGSKANNKVIIVIAECMNDAITTLHEKNLTIHNNEEHIDDYIIGCSTECKIGNYITFTIV